jgi:small subunit ribosomal protein S5e
MAEAAVVAPPNPEVIQPHHDVKLFNRWTFEDITVGFFFSYLSVVLH